MRRLLVLFMCIGLLATVNTASAQSGKCGDDPLYPCGAIPWPIPQFTVLSSPTPYTPRPSPTPVPITPTPSNTPTPTTTPTPTPTFTNHDQQHDDLGTLVYDVNQGIDLLDQTPVARDMAAATAAAAVAEYTGVFFSYAKGLQIFNLKGFGGLVGFLLLGVVFIVLVKLSTALIPVLAGIARWIMRIVQLVVDALPF